MSLGDSVRLNEALSERLIEDLQKVQQDNDMLRQQNAQMQALIAGLADKAELRKMIEYLPQLTHLNNSTSVLASNVGHVNTTLMSLQAQQANVIAALNRIADALTPPKPEEAEE